jgi:hypothetical protein
MYTFTAVSNENKLFLVLHGNKEIVKAITTDKM